MDKSLFILVGTWTAKIVLIFAPLAVCWILAGNPGFLLILVLLGAGAVATTIVDVLWARGAGRRMARIFEGSLLSGEHEIVRADPASFDGIDHSFYDRVADDMRALGFAHLADYEDLTSTRVFPNQRTFSRAFVDAAGMISAHCAHLHPLGFHGRMIRLLEPSAGDLRMLEFMTLMSDGTVVDTNNIGHRPKLDAPPWSDVVAVRPDTSVASLLEQHRAHVAHYCDAHPGVAPATQGTRFEDYLCHVHEELRRRSEWRRARGGITSEEFLRVASPKLQEPAQAVVQAMERDGLLGHERGSSDEH